MSTWNKLISHPNFDRIKTVYNDQFPIEVRFACAYWIEERTKTECSVDINHPEIEKIAGNFLRELIQQLRQEKLQLRRAEQLSIQYRLDAAIATFVNHLHRPFVIYKQIRDTILCEENFIGNVCGNGPTIYDEEAIEITQKLNILKNEVLTYKENLTNYRNGIENYKVLEYRHMVTQLTEVNDVLQQERRLAILEDFQQKKNQTIESINIRWIELHQTIAKLILQINSVQKLLIFNRLDKWQRDQALASNGAPFNKHSLDEIQFWFEKLAEIIWTVRGSIDATRELNTSISLSTTENSVEQAYKEITALLENLITSGFIVEKQPPQVLKTDVNFTSGVRLLTSNLGLQLNNPSIVVSFFLGSESGESIKHCEILNNTGILDHQPLTQHLRCTFNNLKFKKFKRTDKKDETMIKKKRRNYSVTDEKYALIFKTTLRTADIEVNVSVMTLPVVVIVHTYQEPQSWATIMWDNAFCEIRRVPFHVTETVSWCHLVEALNLKITSETDRGLTADCLKYLYEKAFGTSVVGNNRAISWTQFCKEPLTGRTFSFWDWFYAVTKLIKNYVQGPWIDGSIIGFIDRRQTIEKLQQCKAGTFLLRFSESELGGISIAWVDKTAPSRIVMLEPFFSDDFKVRSLADRIRDLDECVTLYPDIPKEVAFKKYCNPPTSVKRNENGYVPAGLKTTVPGSTSNTCICKENFLQLLLEVHGDPKDSFGSISCS